MRASVVIVTYNRLSLLKECLQCVDNQLVKFDDVVIVENCSTDGTIEYLKEKVDKYHIIFEKENGGGAKGFTDGIAYVHKNIKTDWILLIDDDAMLSPNYLQTLLIAAQKEQSCMAFSGSVMTDGKIDLTHRKRVDNSKTMDFYPVPLKEYSNDFFYYDLSSFCGLFFAARLISKIGLPREDYFIWFDDTEYSLRIRKETAIKNINGTFINHKMKKAKSVQKLNWRGYYGTRNGGDVIRTYGTRKQFQLYVRRIKIAQYKNLILYCFTLNSEYKYNYKLYRDALNDLSTNKFGFNPLYHA